MTKHSQHIMNVKKLFKVHPLRSGGRQVYLFSSLLFSIVLKALARVVRQGKQIKSIQIRMKEVKLSLFVDDILYIYNISLRNLPKDYSI